MESETESYTRPERYTPTPEPREMTERERISLREHREAEEAAERERLRPIQEAERRAAEERAEREQRESDRKDKQQSYWRECVLTDRDPQLFVSPELATASMPKSKAETFNAESAAKFVSETPEYAEYKSAATTDAILSYCERNGVNIFDVPTLKAAFIRLRDLGILTKLATAETPKPSPAPTPRRSSVQPAPKDDGLEHGWDWTTGEPLKLTAKQVASLSADNYRRFKKLDRAALELPQFPTNRFAR